MSKVSIILPTFNVEIYIARALHSCVNQTLQDIEIVVVDDCGKDKSMQIAKEFASKDSRIKIIHNPKNLGTFHARLRGIEEASGEYILFLDADDYLELNACELAYKKAQEGFMGASGDSTYLPDIVFFGMRYDPPTLTRVSPKVITKPLYNEEILYEVFAHCATPPWHICAKLYKASHIKRVRTLIVAHMGEDAPLTMAEDVLKSFYSCALASLSVGITNRLYVYCASNSSITRKIDTNTRDKKVSDITRVINEIAHLDTIPQIVENPSFKTAQEKTLRILKSVIALEYRYNTPDNMGGGIIRCIPPYLRACLASLRYHHKWQTYARILIYILSLGRKKI